MNVTAFGVEKAKLAYESQQYAVEHIGAVAKELNVECEYRKTPAQYIVHVSKTDPAYTKENDLKDEYEAMTQIGYPEIAKYEENGQIGEGYVGAILTLENAAAFHPTKYARTVYATFFSKLNVI